VRGNFGQRTGKNQILRDEKLASAQPRKKEKGKLTKYYGIEERQSICNSRDELNKPRDVKLSGEHPAPVLNETLTKTITLGLDNCASCILRAVRGSHSSRLRSRSRCGMRASRSCVQCHLVLRVQVDTFEDTKKVDSE